MHSTEQPLHQTDAFSKIYKTKAIQVATFLGGPLVAGYMVAQNYKAFNDFSKARTAWIYAVIATIAVFVLVLIIPDTSKVPTPLIPLVYSYITYLIVQTYQGKQIDSHLQAAGATFSWWRVIGIALIGAVITFSALFVLLIFWP